MNMLELVLLAFVAVAAAGFLWAYMGWQKTRGALDAADARLALMEESRDSMAEFLKAQASQSAEAVATKLVARATETFQAQDRVARERMEAQLKPVSETLAKFQQHVTALEKARADETGGLKEQLNLLMAASTATRDEARRLTEALKGNTGRRGRWGEQTCRNVLEAAGMAGRFDFEEQNSSATDEGRQQRPDFIVKLPGGGMFVIDAKVSLAFADEADGDEEAQARAMSLRTAASMKTHVRQLSSKAYQDQFKPSPDFVAMFVPGDAFLAAALDHEPDLMTTAMASRVVIVTPTTLFALCKAVAYGWRAEEQARNAEDVAKLGKELYKRLSVMGGHAASVGKALDAAVSRYNQFVGSLESQVMVSARRFEDLKVDHEGKELPELNAVEQSPRALSRPELLNAPE
ncbi:DNA recombination protein RmuC [Brevundimonas diminuta]|jgi:DNA recombination protein RmuC|uniref:DNA recombination protein RmuC homolog n=2 Tax=Brevundimonas diminuta TaxID=293 RepID=A0A1Z3LYK4_BREDI|nr:MULTISPECIES: DNA recombination protein RmuC [Brevundimonas]OJU55065.1 MAG: recombinase RmuC [Brevundimonas sp. 67-6]ASD27262.1 DNA recombination protein RmuC [Brevundimonas diminuta]MBD3573796.1 DNA recombination protein RmuC [Brevundimonas diminuta]MBD3818934.1 DNA recombination protein RmuC [Brevundimonas diminuta]OMG57400.1 recombinase RmuC [Brevundimonas sp. ZS04]